MSEKSAFDNNEAKKNKYANIRDDQQHSLDPGGKQVYDKSYADVATPA